jgi:hypothetical protein
MCFRPNGPARMIGIEKKPRLFEPMNQKISSAYPASLDHEQRRHEAPFTSPDVCSLPTPSAGRSSPVGSTAWRSI